MKFGKQLLNDVILKTKEKKIKHMKIVKFLKNGNTFQIFMNGL